MSQLTKKINPASMRKLKYGATSIVLTCVVVAAVIIFNAIFSSLVYKYSLYVDLTKEGVYGLSDEGRILLDQIDAPVNIRFCSPLDTLESDANSGSAMKMITTLVREICAEYPNITYDYIDIISNPTSAAKYKSTTATSIYTTDIIVESGSEFRVFRANAMFVMNESEVIWAFNGEKKLISAMIQITQAETPIAYFTYTHGETISDSMIELFSDAGYELRTIDLTQEEFDPAGRLLVISNPLYDFEGISEDTKGRKSEIEKIDDFLDDWGNLMVFRDPDTEEMPELDEFLSEWGIQFDDSVLKDPSASLDTEHYALVGDYSIDLTQGQTDANGQQIYNPDALGASLVSSMTELGTPPKTVVKYASPVNRLWDSKDGRITSTVLYSSANAEKYVDGEKVEEGKYPLLVLSRESRYVDETDATGSESQVLHYNYVFACGSQYLTSDDYLGKRAYGNSDIIYAMMRTMGKTQVPADLDFKVFDDESLTITTAEATNWTVFLSVAIPCCFLVAGVVVWLRRKHA